MNRIALVNCYIGTLPDYFQYFYETALLNPEIDFYIFNNTFSQPNNASNVNMIPITLEDFNLLASSKLQVNIDIKQDFGYKLNDFKPAYGVIFEEYLKDYEFWGYCDLDIIWGRVNNFITSEILSNYDVISVEAGHIAGHFTLFRNQGITTDLFRQTDDYIKVFTDSATSYDYDECGFRWRKSYPLDELHQSSQTVSIYDIVMDLKGKGLLRLYLQYISRQFPDPFRYVYRNGVFEDLNLGLEFMYFHLFVVKNDWRFYIPQFSCLPSNFMITPEGIIPGLPGNTLSINKWKINRTLYIINYLFNKLKMIGLFPFFKKIVYKLHGRIVKGDKVLIPRFNKKNKGESN